MHDTLARLRAGRLAGTVRLDLAGCALTEVPPEIFDLAGSLEELNLSGNALDTLPADLGRLTKLRVLFASDNRFTRLPEVVGDCPVLEMVGFKANRIGDVPAAALAPALRWLILTDNAVERLPDAIGACTRMQKLMLAGNRLSALPDAMAQCRALELLRLSANRFERFPGWLFGLPRLAWLAVAGNPWSAARESVALESRPVPAIDWRELEVLREVGQGASGVIHAARWRGETVAVKLFKGAVTSDGWPRSEIAAAVSVGTHPRLIGVLGRLAGHPQGTDGVVMPWVDPAFRNLAGPPSFASCTRDVYADAARWPLAQALRMARGVARATAQLHAHGVVHGDLYAHNILRDAAGDVLLGDFGAAALPPVDDPVAMQALQRIEARAFGLLLGEMLARVDAGDAPAAASPALIALQAACVQPAVDARPSLAEVARRLDDISATDIA